MRQLQPQPLLRQWVLNFAPQAKASVIANVLLLRFEDNLDGISLARQAWGNREALGDFQVEIVIGDRYFCGSRNEPSTIKSECSNLIKPVETSVVRSRFVTKNPNVLEMLSRDSTAIIHSADEKSGYRYLAIAPQNKIEKALCKPLSELLGQPSSAAINPIAEVRSSVIEQAIRSGGIAKGRYEMTWQNLLWRKEVEATYLPGLDEVLVVTRAPASESWQNDFWRNWVD